MRKNHLCPFIWVMEYLKVSRDNKSGFYPTYDSIISWSGLADK